jgi:acetyl-CoA carboxylase, biotin carboxylase subunit
MIRKLLIANRGEIARRIIRTCRLLGIQTVAVYSDADIDSAHVREADEAYRVGPPPVSQSYLQMQTIVDVAIAAGADAIHPGYGLLSENAAFATAVREAGILFVGPSSEAIAAMGSKIEARQRMEQAGVPVVPGSLGAVADIEEAVRVAGQIGYPVMLKASGGGGGIGMQIAEDEDTVRKAFASNQNRAKAYFGNGDMFVEKYIVSPRHIEIQVLFDAQGHGVYLFERECSIQRRHQKVVEEAPSPFLSQTLRESMGQAALSAAASIGYTNAGTIEFLVDADESFYFLEMNTRLQVEHPVTESITGLDLVEWQLRITDGEALSFTQESLHMKGHAIEVRLYAEDPVKMLPSPGTVTSLRVPMGEGIRNDNMLDGPGVVTPFYDPMIGKLIVSAPTREEAIRRLSLALADYEITGIKTNLSLLQKIVSSPAFAAGNTTTDFIQRYLS